MQESGVVNVPLDVQGEYYMSGVAARGGRVRPGGALYLSGVMEGTLTVMPGGHAEISGVFDGVLENGGRVTVSGVFAGTVGTGSGELLAYAGSVFRRGGRDLRLQSDGSLLEGDGGGATVIIAGETPMCRLVYGTFRPAT